MTHFICFTEIESDKDEINHHDRFLEQSLEEINEHGKQQIKSKNKILFKVVKKTVIYTTGITLLQKQIFCLL